MMPRLVGMVAMRRMRSSNRLEGRPERFLDVEQGQQHLTQGSPVEGRPHFEQDEEDAAGKGRYRKEVDRDQLAT
jgi:hypothetical protein